MAIRQLMDTGAKLMAVSDATELSRTYPENEALSALNPCVICRGDKIVVMDPMAGGGSIPFESARLGIKTIANEYNPVACTILKASEPEYPSLSGEGLFEQVRHWKAVWMKNISARLDKYYRKHSDRSVQAYILPELFLARHKTPNAAGSRLAPA